MLQTNVADLWSITPCLKKKGGGGEGCDEYVFGRLASFLLFPIFSSSPISSCFHMEAWGRHHSTSEAVQGLHVGSSQQ